MPEAQAARSSLTFAKLVLIYDSQQDSIETVAKKLIETVVKRRGRTTPRQLRNLRRLSSRELACFNSNEKSLIRIALLNAAKYHLRGDVTVKVAGPSNIGNCLAKLGIDATAGLGERYDALHGTDEQIELVTIPAIQATYHEALLMLLNGQ